MTSAISMTLATFATLVTLLISSNPVRTLTPAKLSASLVQLPVAMLIDHRYYVGLAIVLSQCPAYQLYSLSYQVCADVSVSSHGDTSCGFIIGPPRVVGLRF